MGAVSASFRTGTGPHAPCNGHGDEPVQDGIVDGIVDDAVLGIVDESTAGGTDDRFASGRREPVASTSERLSRIPRT
jgi:hypothetical protein